MRSKADTHSEEAEKAVRGIRRATRRQYSAEDKVRIVIAGPRGEYRHAVRSLGLGSVEEPSGHR